MLPLAAYAAGINVVEPISAEIRNAFIIILPTIQDLVLHAIRCLAVTWCVGAWPWCPGFSTWTRRLLLRRACALRLSIGWLLHYPCIAVSTPGTITATIWSGPRHWLTIGLADGIVRVRAICPSATALTAPIVLVVAAISTATPIAISDSARLVVAIAPTSRTFIASSAVAFGPSYRLVCAAVGFADPNAIICLAKPDCRESNQWLGRRHV